MSEVAFPLEEFRSRLTAARAGMARAGLDVLVACAPENLYYLSGYESTGHSAVQGLLVPLDGEPVLVTRDLETPNVSASYVWSRHVAYQDHHEPLAVLARELDALGFAEQRLGLETSARFLLRRLRPPLRSRPHNVERPPAPAGRSPLPRAGRLRPPLPRRAHAPRRRRPGLRQAARPRGRQPRGARGRSRRAEARRDLGRGRPGDPRGDPPGGLGRAYYHHRSGYAGMGFASWSEGHILSIREDDPTPIEAGMVFHLIPGIVIEGEALVSVSETVIVTEAGAEPVCSVPRALAVR